MAKKSMRAREDKRMKLVSQYDEKRTALKKQIKKTNSFQV